MIASVGYRNMRVTVALVMLIVMFSMNRAKPVVKLKILRMVTSGPLKCPLETSKLVRTNGTIKCLECSKCAEGFAPSIPCGSVTYDATSQRKCVACVHGTTYSNSNDSSTCKRCSVCGNEKTIVTKCSRVSDTVCGKCKRGYYFSVKTLICFPCSHCCGDSQDHVEDECAKQGLPKGKQCSIHSNFRCSPKPATANSTAINLRNLENDSPVTTTSPDFEKTVYQTYTTTRATAMPRHPGSTILYRDDKTVVKMIVYMVVTSIIIIMLFVILGFYCIKHFSRKQKCKSKKQLRFKREQPLTSEVSAQASDLNDWSENDSNRGSYKFKSGIIVHYNKFSKADSEKELAVEEIRDSDKNFMVNRETNQAFLSPIFQFYSKGETFEKPVKITLPHSAHVDSSNAWNIQVLCADLRKGEKVKWMGVEDDVVVEAHQISFSTSTLLAYVVVGSPKAPGGTAKKHMQFAVFSSLEMIDNVFKAILYLFDDNETLFQRIQQEEKKSGRKMLGSFYAAFIDCFDDKTITVKIKGISAGCKLEELVPGSIRAEQCANSYFDVPKWEATFRRVGPCDIKFQCTFAVDAAGKQINVPACVCFPEVFPSVYVGTVDVLGKDLTGSESLLRDLSSCAKAGLCRTLDIPYRGVGSWRELGRALCLPSREVEVCSKQYAHVDGSPTTVLFEMLEARMPHLTVGELVDVMKQMGRFDVVKILQECDYKV